MTVSFHKYGEFFPGTGELHVRLYPNVTTKYSYTLKDMGLMKGKNYSLNFPLRDGITDEAYKSVFEPVISQVMESYNPSAIVLQCGTDSLAGDKLGPFNLSMRGHANCVKFVKSLNRPLLLLGGGGYTMRNVSRAWAYETGLAAGMELGPDIPVNEYYEYFGPDYQLDVRASNADDMNTPAYLERVKNMIMDNLRAIGGPPSVQMQGRSCFLAWGSHAHAAFRYTYAPRGPRDGRRTGRRRPHPTRCTAPTLDPRRAHTA